MSDSGCWILEVLLPTSDIPNPIFKDPLSMKRILRRLSLEIKGKVVCFDVNLVMIQR